MESLSISTEKVNKLLRKELQALSSKRGATSFSIDKKIIKEITFFDFLVQKLLMVDLIEHGISTGFFMSVVQSSSFSLKEWSLSTNIPYRTIQRYKNEQLLLTPFHTEKIFEFSEVLKRGVEVFGSEEKFKHWLYNPKYIFNNKRPIDLLNNSIGKDIVLQELNRIEHGIFS